MINKDLYFEKANILKEASQRDAAKHALYHTINHSLRQSGNVAFIDVYRKEASILIEVCNELRTEGIPADVFLNEDDEPFLRLFLKD